MQSFPNTSIQVETTEGNGDFDDDSQEDVQTPFPTANGAAPTPKEATKSLFTPPSAAEEKMARRYRSQIRQLVKNYPKVDIHSTTPLSEELRDMDVEELKEILDNVKEQCTGISPYATTEAMLGFFGTFVEHKFQLVGLGKRFSSDVDLISVIDEILPTKAQDCGGIATALWCLAKSTYEAWQETKEKNLKRMQPLPEDDDELLGKYIPRQKRARTLEPEEPSE